MDKEPLDKENPADSKRSLGSALDDVEFRPVGRRVVAKKGVARRRLVVRKTPSADGNEPQGERD